MLADGSLDRQQLLELDHSHLHTLQTSVETPKASSSASHSRKLLEFALPRSPAGSNPPSTSISFPTTIREGKEESPLPAAPRVVSIQRLSPLRPPDSNGLTGIYFPLSSSSPAFSLGKGAHSPAKDPLSISNQSPRGLKSPNLSASNTPGHSYGSSFAQLDASSYETKAHRLRPNPPTSGSEVLEPPIKGGKGITVFTPRRQSTSSDIPILFPYSPQFQNATGPFSAIVNSRRKIQDEGEETAHSVVRQARPSSLYTLMQPRPITADNTRETPSPPPASKATEIGPRLELNEMSPKRPALQPRIPLLPPRQARSAVSEKRSMLNAFIVSNLHAPAERETEKKLLPSNWSPRGFRSVENPLEYRHHVPRCSPIFPDAPGPSHVTDHLWEPGSIVSPQLADSHGESFQELQRVSKLRDASVQFTALGTASQQPLSDLSSVTHLDEKGILLPHTEVPHSPKLGSQLYTTHGSSPLRKHAPSPLLQLPQLPHGLAAAPGPFFSPKQQAKFSPSTKAPVHRRIKESPVGEGEGVALEHDALPSEGSPPLPQLLSRPASPLHLNTELGPVRATRPHSKVLFVVKGKAEGSSGLQESGGGGAVGPHFPEAGNAMDGKKSFVPLTPLAMCTSSFASFAYGSGGGGIASGEGPVTPLMAQARVVDGDDHSHNDGGGMRDENGIEEAVVRIASPASSVEGLAIPTAPRSLSDALSTGPSDNPGMLGRGTSSGILIHRLPPTSRKNSTCSSVGSALMPPSHVASIGADSADGLQASPTMTGILVPTSPRSPTPGKEGREERAASGQAQPQRVVFTAEESVQGTGVGGRSESSHAAGGGCNSEVASVLSTAGAPSSFLLAGGRTSFASFRRVRDFTGNTELTSTTTRGLERKVSWRAAVKTGDDPRVSTILLSERERANPAVEFRHFPGDEAPSNRLRQSSAANSLVSTIDELFNSPLREVPETCGRLFFGFANNVGDSLSSIAPDEPFGALGSKKPVSRGELSSFSRRGPLNRSARSMNSILDCGLVLPSCPPTQTANQSRRYSFGSLPLQDRPPTANEDPQIPQQPSGGTGVPSAMRNPRLDNLGDFSVEFGNGTSINAATGGMQEGGVYGGVLHHKGSSMPACQLSFTAPSSDAMGGGLAAFPRSLLNGALLELESSDGLFPHTHSQGFHMPACSHSAASQPTSSVRTHPNGIIEILDLTLTQKSLLTGPSSSKASFATLSPRSAHEPNEAAPSHETDSPPTSPKQSSPLPSLPPTMIRYRVLTRSEKMIFERLWIEEKSAFERMQKRRQEEAERAQRQQDSIALMQQRWEEEQRAKRKKVSAEPFH